MKKVIIRKTYDGHVVAESMHHTEDNKIAIERAVKKHFGERATVNEEYENKGTYVVLKPFSNASADEPGRQNLGRFNISVQTTGKL